MLSNVTSFFVAIVKFLPACVISMLSPSMNLTVSPPLTSSAVPLLATTFQAARSLTFCSPAGFKLLKSLSAALSILFLVAVSSLTVTSLPAAVVAIPSSPLILKLTAPSFKDFSVVEPVLPSKEILLASAVVFFWIAVLLASALASVFFN